MKIMSSWLTLRFYFRFFFVLFHSTYHTSLEFYSKGRGIFHKLQNLKVRGIFCFAMDHIYFVLFVKVDHFDMETLIWYGNSNFICGLRIYGSICSNRLHIIHDVDPNFVSMHDKSFVHIFLNIVVEDFRCCSKHFLMLHSCFIHHLSSEIRIPFPFVWRLKVCPLLQLQRWQCLNQHCC